MPSLSPLLPCGFIALALGCTQPNPSYTRDDGAADGRAASLDAPSADRKGEPLDATRPVSGDAGAAAGLIGLWPMDEGSGALVADRSGRGNDGTLTGVDPTTAWKPGRHGTAIEIPDVLPASVVVPASASINAVRTGFTIAAWVNRTTAVAGTRHTVVASRQLGTTNRELYTLAFQNEALIMWLYSEPPAANISLRANRAAPVATWLHVAVTWDGQTVRLYPGGGEVGTLSFSATLLTSTNPLLLGNNANSDGVNQPLIGRLDDVRLYDRALSAAEIAQLAGS